MALSTLKSTEPKLRTYVSEIVDGAKVRPNTPARLEGVPLDCGVQPQVHLLDFGSPELQQAFYCTTTSERMITIIGQMGITRCSQGCGNLAFKFSSWCKCTGRKCCGCINGCEPCLKDFLPLDSKSPVCHLEGCRMEVRRTIYGEGYCRQHHGNGQIINMISCACSKEFIPGCEAQKYCFCCMAENPSRIPIKCSECTEFFLQDDESAAAAAVVAAAVCKNCKSHHTFTSPIQFPVKKCANDFCDNSVALFSPRCADCNSLIEMQQTASPKCEDDASHSNKPVSPTDITMHEKCRDYTCSNWAAKASYWCIECNSTWETARQQQAASASTQ